MVLGRFVASSLLAGLFAISAAHAADIARAYDALLDRELGRVRVGVRSAIPLSDEVHQQMVALARRLAGKDVLVDSEVDPELLGGVVLDVGGTVYDGSVRTRLARMSRTMAEGSR